MTEDITEVLTEDLDGEVLKRMPVWFRILREVYGKQVCVRRNVLKIAPKQVQPKVIGGNIRILFYPVSDVVLSPPFPE